MTCCCTEHLYRSHHRRNAPEGLRPLGPSFASRVHGGPSNLTISRKLGYAIMALPVRRLIAIQILLALVPAVFSAPLLHLHGHENTDHFVKAHRAQALGSHTHFSTCQCGGGHSGTVVMTASRDDDDAVFLNWFQDNPHRGAQPGIRFGRKPCRPRSRTERGLDRRSNSPLARSAADLLSRSSLSSHPACLPAGRVVPRLFFRI